MVMTILRGDLGLRGERCGESGLLWALDRGRSKRLGAVARRFLAGRGTGSSRGAGQHWPQPRTPCSSLDAVSRPEMNSSSPLLMTSLQCNKQVNIRLS